MRFHSVICDLVSIAHRDEGRVSQHYPLDLVLRQALFRPVVKFGGARALVRRHRLRMLQRAADSGECGQ
jgi:hypothetical protein